MELKHLTKIIYRIEPKPEGGFIASAVDPTVAPLEAPTRGELQQKIQAQIAAELGAELANLKLPFGKKLVDIQIERKPGTSFTVHPTGANMPQELVALLQKSFPELNGALAARGGDGKTFGTLNQQKDIVMNVSSQKFSIAQSLPVAALTRASATDMQIGSPEADSNALNVFDNIAITPEPSSSWRIFRILLAFLILAALAYFFRHH